MSELNDHSSRDHALLSASSAHRWLNCPPSAVAAEAYPQQDTEFTREGTLAHEVAELVARASVDGRDIHNFPWKDDVNAEMVECAKGYADYIQEQIHNDDAPVLLEQRVDFSPWVPEGFGTADCIIIQGDTMDVIDYKYGKGVAVSAVENPQELLYGLGAMNDYGFVYSIENVRLHIYQPRMNNVSTERLSREELLAFGESVKPVAQLAAKGKGEFRSGEHCRFCPHAGACPKLSSDCMKVFNGSGGKAAVPTLSPWMVADLLKVEPMISAWLKAVKDRALASMLNGEEIPGFKVVEGRLGNRKWSEEGRVLKALIQAGFSSMEVTETKLLSPAGMDKAIGKKKVAELLSGLIERAPGAPTVAPESDKRKPFDRLAEARKDFE